MPTLEQVDAFRAGIDDLSTLAIRDTKTLLASLSGASGVETRNALIEYLPSMIDPYVTASSELAAGWYEELRADAIGGRFYATADAAVNRAQVNALVRYGVKPLFGQSDASPLSLIGGGVQKLVAGASRDTIDTNITRDPVIVGYARTPQPGCCAFCGMLASRGAVYRSGNTAGEVVGRGVDSSIALDENGNRRQGYVGGVGKGVKARGVQGLGEKFHDFCRCVATPVFSGADNSAVTETTDKYMDMYLQSVGTSTSAYSKKDPTNAQFESVSAKETLANWRREFGTK